MDEPFYPPPFSVIDTRKGSWRRRVNYWNRMGAKGNVVGLRGANRDGTMTGFDGALCEVAYTWLMPKCGVVLDPFAGGVTRGLVASMTGNIYHGIEVRAEQIALNMANNHAPNINYYHGDSRRLDDLIPKNLKADLVFTSPPYADVERYSDDPRDLSTMDYAAFVHALRESLHAAIARLNDNRYAVIVMGEARGDDGLAFGVIPDTHIILRDAGLRLYNELIFLQPIGDFRFGAMAGFEKSRKFRRIHQHILIYSKGEPYCGT